MSNQAKVNLIKKIEVIEGGGHHGGAWKVAYADFMTAMMAFFLLLWILSSSDEQKLRGIAEYFTNATLPGGSGVLDGATLGPPGTLSASNGATEARGAEAGTVDDASPAKWEVHDITPTADPEETALGTEVGQFENPAGGDAAEEMPETVTELEHVAHAGGMSSGEADEETEAEKDAKRAQAAAQAELQASDDAAFEALQNELYQAMQDHPDLRPLARNVVFDQTPEGLRIQIVDQDGQPMFASGKATMTAATELLLSKFAESISDLPNDLVIAGHTDAVPFSRSDYDNWDLSSDRANETRRLLARAGVERERITRVSGLADTELLVPEAPEHPSNRRISMVLNYQRAELPAPVEAMEKSTKEEPAAPEPMKKAMSEPETTEPAVPEVIVLDEAVFENLRSALR